MIDTTEIETASRFGANSINKIPWAALASNAKRYMMIKDNDAAFISNINFAGNLVLTDADFTEIFS
jgi:hypothetical protein